MNAVFVRLTLLLGMLAICCLNPSAPEVVAQGNPAVEVPKITLPPWFLQNRVQLHSDITLIRLGEVLGVPESVKRVQELGTGVFTCHLDQTRAPGWTPEQEKLFRQFVEAFHTQRIRFIAYSHLLLLRTGKAEAARDPRVARTLSGDPAEFPARRQAVRDSYWLDITEPAVTQEVLQRFMALGALQVDGFYLDGTQLPPQGVFGTALQQAFVRETGRAVPGNSEASNPDYIAYLKFQARALERTLLGVLGKVRAKFPQLVFIVSVRGYAAAMNYSDPSSYVAQLDVVKSEYPFPINPGLNYQVFRAGGVSPPPPDVMLAFGWTLLRDTTDGRPPHIWNAAFDTSDEMLVFAQTLTSYGAVANLHIDGKVLMGARAEFARVAPMYQGAFRFGKTISPYLTGPPERYAAVLFSEGARDAHNGNFRMAWSKVVGPSMALFEACVREGIPVGIVPDARCESAHLKNYRLLLLPASAQLSPAQQAAVKQFQAGGGRVLDGSSPEWAISGYEPGQIPALREKLRALCADAPVALQPGYQGKVHLVAYRKGNQMLLTLNNDFGWLAKRDRSAGPRVPPAQKVEVLVRNTRVARATDLFSKADVPLARVAGGVSVGIGAVPRGRFFLLELQP